jgi:hypothetical protein
LFSLVQLMVGMAFPELHTVEDSLEEVTLLLPDHSRRDVMKLLSLKNMFTNIQTGLDSTVPGKLRLITDEK